MRRGYRRRLNAGSRRNAGSPNQCSCMRFFCCKFAIVSFTALQQLVHVQTRSEFAKQRVMKQRVMQDGRGANNSAPVSFA